MFFFCCLSVLSSLPSPIILIFSLSFFARVVCFPLYTRYISLSTSAVLRRLQSAIPRSHNAPSRIISSGRRGNEMQKNINIFGDISYTSLCFVSHVAHEEADHQKQIVHPSPGIMCHNFMFRSDWHGERHREGWGNWLVAERENKKKKKKRERGGIMMMRVMMRGCEPKQSNNEKKKR